MCEISPSDEMALEMAAATPEQSSSSTVNSMREVDSNLVPSNSPASIARAPTAMCRTRACDPRPMGSTGHTCDLFEGCLPACDARQCLFEDGSHARATRALLELENGCFGSNEFARHIVENQHLGYG